MIKHTQYKNTQAITTWTIQLDTDFSMFAVADAAGNQEEVKQEIGEVPGEKK